MKERHYKSHRDISVSVFNEYTSSTQKAHMAVSINIQYINLFSLNLFFLLFGL